MGAVTGNSGNESVRFQFECNHLLWNEWYITEDKQLCLVSRVNQLSNQYTLLKTITFLKHTSIL